MSDHVTDPQRLADTVHVLHGERGSGALQRMSYAVYVAVLLAATYGFTVARAIVAQSGPEWMRATLASPITWVVAAAVVVMAVVMAFRAGRARGPIVPPLPWIDLVVTSSIDRARTLRQWWTFAFVGGLAGGVIVGAVLGAGVWASGAGGPAWLVVAVIGAVVGWAAARAWLSGQATGSHPLPGEPGEVSATADLRRLDLDELRAHSARSTRMAGGVLAGDLRSVRLEVAAPITHGRRLRLRAGGPMATVVRRDILGLRRMPGSFRSGVALMAMGAAGVAWAVHDPQVPTVLAGAAMLLCYFGFGSWAEGLRLLGDNAGTPPLFGLGFRREALAHLAAPLVMGLVVLLPVGLGVTALLSGASWEFGRMAALGGVILVLLTGAHLLAAFRGAPPEMAFIPEMGPPMMAYWYARPITVAAISGGLLVSRAAHPDRAWTVIVIGAFTALGMTWWGSRQASKVEAEHRI